MNTYGVSLPELESKFMKSMIKLRNRESEMDIWKEQNGYKRMNKKRWEQWFQQNLK